MNLDFPLVPSSSLFPLFVGTVSWEIMRPILLIELSTVSQTKELVSPTVNSGKAWKDWKKSGNKAFPLLDVDKTFTLFEESISCPLKNGSGLSLTAGVKADLRGSFHLDLNLGYAAKGTLTPPKVKSFALFGN